MDPRFREDDAMKRIEREVKKLIVIASGKSVSDCSVAIQASRYYFSRKVRIYGTENIDVSRQIEKTIDT